MFTQPLTQVGVTQTFASSDDSESISPQKYIVTDSHAFMSAIQSAHIVSHPVFSRVQYHLQQCGIMDVTSNSFLIHYSLPEAEFNENYRIRI